MNSLPTKTLLALAAGFGLMSPATPLIAHDVPNVDHTHVYRQTSYGVLRQGHVVSGRHGDIVIWSAQPQTGFQPANPVRFARPERYRKDAEGPVLKSPLKQDPARNYGKQFKRDYGK